MLDLPLSLQPYPRARRIALVIAWIKTGLAVLFAFATAIGGGGSDPAGRAFLYGGFGLASAYWVVFILPILLLLRGDTRQRVAASFGLLILPDVLITLAALEAVIEWS